MVETTLFRLVVGLIFLAASSFLIGFRYGMLSAIRDINDKIDQMDADEQSQSN